MNTLISLAAPLFKQTPYHQDDYDDNQRQQSRSQKQTNSRSKTKKSISLENYLAFLPSRDFSFFTVEQLRQIKAIHGFKKKGSRRKELEEAVAAMELINPARSTLNEKVSPEAFVTVKEVMMDLETLNWKECSITSIRTISSLNKSPANPPQPVTKPATRKTKKRSAAAPSDYFSASTGILKGGRKESDSVGGSSSSNNADGLVLLALVADPEKDEGGKKQCSRKRKSIKRVPLA